MIKSCCLNGYNKLLFVITISVSTVLIPYHTEIVFISLFDNYNSIDEVTSSIVCYIWLRWLMCGDGSSYLWNYHTVDGRHPAPPTGWLKHVETLWNMLKHVETCWNPKGKGLNNLSTGGTLPCIYGWGFAAARGWNVPRIIRPSLSGAVLGAWTEPEIRFFLCVFVGPKHLEIIRTRVK